jgi:ubiquinone/menaquinone biosynthesis C-methylase UbiE
MLSKLQSVQTYFDSDAGRYGDQRYPDDPKTSEQLSYLVRRRYVLDMLGRGAPKPGLILDLGCGPGVYTTALLERGWRLWGVDLAPKMLQVAKGRTEGRPGAGFAVGQTTRLPFRPGSFDAVVCIGVMAYVEDERQTIKEIARMLKPGGCAVIQIANFWAPIRAEYRVRWEVGRRLRKGPPDEEDKLREQVRLATQVPGPFLNLCREEGFAVHERRFYDFRVPALTRIWPSAGLAVGRAFEPVGERGWLGWWGAGFLARLEKGRG